MNSISLIFPYPKTRKVVRKKPKNRKLVKFHNDYTEVQINNMDDSQVEQLYEHGTPGEREIAEHIIRLRKRWDEILNKSLDDTLPSGSGSPGAPTAPIAGSGKF